MAWLVFSYSLSTKSSSSPRVTLWRRLKRLGAISMSGGIYVLPEQADCLERFQWLAQEVQQASGEAVVMWVERFEGLPDSFIIQQFHAAHQDEYGELNGALDALLRSPANSSPTKAHAGMLEELEKLRKRFRDLSRIDYFHSPEGAAVGKKIAQLSQRLVTGRTPEAQVEPVAPQAFKDRVWVTRPQPHVDRLACIWLIRRFIDAHAVIRYRDQGQGDEVSFDMTNAVFGHTGNLCTFETMLAAFSLENDALREMAEIVHELDLRDGRYARPEATGLDAVLEGWRQQGLSDEELEAHGTAVFEGLYISLLTATARNQSVDSASPFQRNKAL
jgi:hypothetical protein